MKCEEKLDKYVYIKSVVDDNNNILGYESANKNDFLYFVIENKKYYDAINKVFLDLKKEKIDIKEFYKKRKEIKIKYLYCKSEIHRIEKKSLKENRDILKIFLNMLLGEDKCK